MAFFGNGIAPGDDPLEKYGMTRPVGSGLLNGPMEGLLGNPLFSMGLGILAANRPGASFGEALGQGGLLGLQNAAQFRNARSDDELRRIKIAREKRAMEADEAWRRMFGGGPGPVAGAPGPQIAPVDPNAAPGSPGSVFTADPNAPGSELRPVAPANPMLSGVPPQMMPLIAAMGPERGGSMLAQFAMKDASRAQWVPENRNGIPGQVNKTTGEWKPLDPSLAKVSVGVNLPPQQNELEKTFAEFRKQGLETEMQSPGRMAKLDQLGALLDQVNTGKFAGTTLELKRAAKAAGINLDALGIRDDVAPAQAAQALSRELALQLRNPAGGAGMPGALSDADRRFLESMVPSIENDPQANRTMLQWARKLEQRNLEVARKMREYAKKHKGLDDGFFDELAQWSEQNPLFAGSEAPGAGAGPRPMPTPGTVQDGYRFKGGNPADPNSWEKL